MIQFIPELIGGKYLKKLDFVIIKKELKERINSPKNIIKFILTAFARYAISKLFFSVK